MMPQPDFAAGIAVPSAQPPMPSENTIAWVFGQPVTDVPQDLFIPPDALKVVLGSFQGPLDLLLYLIRKQNIDVLDIPMVKITEQYLHYIAQVEAYQFDLAAEYLLMAAVLIEIKSRLLLPRPQEAEEEEADPRAELVRRLLAYEQMKLAAQGLDALPRAGRDFAWAYLPLENRRRSQAARSLCRRPDASLARHPFPRQAYAQPRSSARSHLGARADDVDSADFERKRFQPVFRPVPAGAGRGLSGGQFHRAAGTGERGAGQGCAARKLR